MTAEPLRERRWAQLMVALYRSGRQADALRAYERLRAGLAEQLGIEPGGELRALEEAILLQKPDLETTKPAPRPEGFGVRPARGSLGADEARGTGPADIVAGRRGGDLPVQRHRGQHQPVGTTSRGDGRRRGTPRPPHCRGHTGPGRSGVQDGRDAVHAVFAGPVAAVRPPWPSRPTSPPAIGVTRPAGRADRHLHRRGPVGGGGMAGPAPQPLRPSA